MACDETPQIDLPESSISRRRSSTPPTEFPCLKHTLQEMTPSPILSVAASRTYVFAGSQSGDINVWDRELFQPVGGPLKGHDGAVGALLVIEERGWLISSGGDGIIRIWCLKTFSPLLILHPFSAGTIFTLLWSPTTSTLYCGSQSTTIQWIDLPSSLVAPSVLSHSPRLGSIPKSKFFDSCPPSGMQSRSSFGNSLKDEGDRTPEMWIDLACSKRCSSGYVYALALAKVGDRKGKGRDLIASASGDGDVKIWDHSAGPSLELVASFPGEYEAALSLAVSDSTLYAGFQRGEIKVFDLETKSLIRTLIGHQASVLSLARFGSDLYSASSDGRLLRWGSSFDCTASFQAHKGAILGSTVFGTPTRKGELFTAGNDGLLQVWSIPSTRANPLSPSAAECSTNGQTNSLLEEILLGTLARLVSYRTIPTPEHREDCRQGALFLKRTLTQLGAEAALLPNAPGRNPLVLATFRGKETKRKRKRVLFYGHYDVVSADPEKWTSNPWTLTGRNGYIYGRGVADNKGPILAIATAASSLLERRTLDVDLVMIIEGEEEAGSHGFANAVRTHKESIGEIDCILVSNSSWIGEDSPCITYGLRGVVHMQIEISSDKPDLHSGVEGGGAAEPMIDMIGLLSTLTNGKNRIAVPHFYDDVRQLAVEEQERYASLSALTGRTAENLTKRFAEPSFSVGSVGGPGGNPTIIPSRVQSAVSFRLVPDQELDKIVTSIEAFVEASFNALGSSNVMTMTVPHRADWWLGDLSSPESLLMEACIAEVWGVQDVLRIREGGSIPSIPFLEKEFSAQAIHLPMGQSSDNGHLQDERLRLANLLNGQHIFSRFLEELGGHCYE